jgi:hypothetical protein
VRKINKLKRYDKEDLHALLNRKEIGPLFLE